MCRPIMVLGHVRNYVEWYIINPCNILTCNTQNAEREMQNAEYIRFLALSVKHLALSIKY